MKRHDDYFMGIDGKTLQVGVFFSGYMRLNGTPVTRDKYTYPYSYEEFVQFKSPDYKGDYDNGWYSDRILQWDYDKHNKLCEKHFGNERQYWDDRSPDLIENFLKDYFDIPNLKLLVVLEGCNPSSGYPYWVFLVKNGETK